MKAFILAAGQGTRMRPLTKNTPKPLLPVAGKPILKHNIELLRERVDEIIVLVGWRAKRIKDTLAYPEEEITFVKQEKQLGTAHAISKAEKYFEDKVICLNGDILLPDDVINDFIDGFQATDKSLIGMAEVEDPSEYGVIETDSDGVVKALIEKPSEPISNMANAGIYGFDTSIFEAIKKTEKSPRGEYEITDSMEFLIKEKKLKGFPIKKEDWVELSRPWELLSANKKLLSSDFSCIKEGRKGRIEDNVHLEGFVSLEKDAVIREGTYIQGPVCIGEGSDIGPNTYIRSCTTIGKNCRIGAAVEIKNSIVMDGTNIPHHNYVGDSVIGRNCNFGSGTKVANLRLDESNIIVTHRGEKIDTNRRKLGVIMGDDVKTGINSMINTGTIIGDGTFLGPGAVADGEIGENSRIQ